MSRGCRVMLAGLGAVFGMAATCLAGAMYQNTSGAVARVIRIEFSEPAEISSMYPSFPQRDPWSPATTITLSGGEVAAGGWLSFTWRPETARVTRIEWLAQREVASPSIVSYAVETSSPGGHKLQVVVEIQRQSIPFKVRCSVDPTTRPAGSHAHWDLDKYVDTNGDGDPRNDRDLAGWELEVPFTENYNPTAVLWVVDNAEQASYVELMLRNDVLIQTAILLDGASLLLLNGVDPADVTEPAWQQHYMEEMGLEYMTENAGRIREENSLVASFSADYPGRYVLSLSVRLSNGSTASFFVHLWITQESTRRMPVGFMMADIWNECYEDATRSMVDCDLFFSDLEALAKLAYLRQEGFDNILVMNQVAMVKVSPLPRLTVADAGIHLIGPADLRMLFDRVGGGHLAFQTFYFRSEGGVPDDYWHDWYRRDQAYYAEFFRQYIPHIVDKARLAQEIDLRSLTIGFQDPYLRGLCSLESVSFVTANWMLQQWVNLLSEVRSVYAGRIGIGVPDLCYLTRPLGRYIDFLYENLGGFRGEAATLKWAKTVADLREAYSTWLDRRVKPIATHFGKPIWFTFWAYSYKGASTQGWTPDLEQTIYDSWRESYSLPGRREDIFAGWSLPDRYKPSFREQVLMIEALLPVLASKDYVEAIFSQYEYWKLLDFRDFTPQNIIDYTQILWGSLQGKPAFEVYKLWASILDPTEANLYRRAHVFQAAKRIGEVTVLPVEVACSQVSQQDVFLVAEAIEGRGADVRVFADSDPEVGSVLRILYTPRVADRWGDLFSGVFGRLDEPLNVSGCTHLSFDYRVSSPGVPLFVVLTDSEREAFTLEHRPLIADGSWHRVQSPFSSLRYGGFNTPEDGNRALDGVIRIDVYTAVLNAVGQTVTLEIANLRLTRTGSD